MDGTLSEPGAISYDLMYSRTGNSFVFLSFTLFLFSWMSSSLYLPFLICHFITSGPLHLQEPPSPPNTHKQNAHTQTPCIFCLAFVTVLLLAWVQFDCHCHFWRYFIISYHSILCCVIYIMWTLRCSAMISYYIILYHIISYHIIWFKS